MKRGLNLSKENEDKARTTAKGGGILECFIDVVMKLAARERPSVEVRL